MRNAHGFYSYYRLVTATTSAVTWLASDVSTYRIHKSVVQRQLKGNCSGSRSDIHFWMQSKTRQFDGQPSMCTPFLTTGLVVTFTLFRPKLQNHPQHRQVNSYYDHLVFYDDKIPQREISDHILSRHDVDLLPFHVKI